MTGAPRLVVALETSARPPSIAASVGAGDAVERRLTRDRSHASDLLVELESLARDLGVDHSQLDLVIVGTGPGSYTGLRVGAATALGLHRGSGAALVGISSFEAIALSGLEVGERGAVVRNAFGGQVYRAVYERGEHGVTPIQVPACLGPSAALEGLAHGSILLADDDACGALGAALDTLGADLRGDVAPRADALLRLGRARFESSGADDPTTVRPQYLRAYEAKVRTR